MDQLIHKFEKTETQYRDLKDRLGRGEITSEQAKAEIKGMMIQDDTGTYWMMGGKTGKWYKHINNQWQEANPYEEISPPLSLEPEPVPEPEPQPRQQEQVKKENASFSLDSYQTEEPAASESESESEPLFATGSEPVQSDAGADASEEAFSLSQEDQQTSHTGYQFDANAQVQDAGGIAEPTAQESDDSLDKYNADSFSNFDTGGSEESIDAAGASTVNFTGLSQSEGIQGSSFVQGEGQNIDFGGLDSNYDAGGGGQTVELGSLGSDYEAGGGGHSTDFGGLAEGYESSSGSSIDFSQQEDQQTVGLDLNSDSGPGLDSGRISAESEGADIGHVSPDTGFEDTGGSQLNPVDTNEFSLRSASNETGGISIDLDQADELPGSAEPMVSEITQEPADEQPLFTQPTVQEPITPHPQPTMGAIGTMETSTAPAGDAALPALDGANLTQCVVCQSKIPNIAIFCTYCGANQKELGGKKKKSKKKNVQAGEENEMVIKSIRVLSFLFFFGGLGLIAGVISGATFGVLKTFMADLHVQLPIMLQESRGGLAGGLIFAAIGGIGGFIAAALASVVISGIYNLISFVFGGIRLKIKG